MSAASPFVVNKKSPFGGFSPQKKFVAGSDSGVPFKSAEGAGTGECQPELPEGG
jgi:hypothetical protein